jgi:phenylpropionate dioxygenase-like ring-hydroxylating dioxygenase large terminal subunit
MKTMLPNHWYAILESNEVKRGKPLGVTRMGEKLVGWRNGRGEIAVLIDRCPHRGVALSTGQILGDCVECPFHGFQFDATGRCTVIPANGKNTPVPKAFNATSYQTREAHGFIWAWYGEPRDPEQLPPLPFFDDLDDSFSALTLRDHWTVHYTRAIENQLDVVHLPFIHKTTIGRGGQTVVDGPFVKLEGDRMLIWFDNRVDDGAPPRKWSEMSEPSRLPLITFLFPNIWQNRLGENMRIVIAFAPIDDENTMLYARQYQRIMRTPGLRVAFDYVLRIGNNVILKQDKRAVITEVPKKTWAGMDEALIQGDRPIILFRQRRKELLEAAGRPAH